ncbi:hypothetical protein [Cohnella hashimotonis]|uniref:Uncharacterized protein n=1 Tax=Cohnella hashimotonis TaxID=2826895 RepID=A0ABT6TAD5_9BACL|nr:hypothetical protein [Cohnella hashimotonis]MDI4643798.1 hypothetical protein [Cohnella hashimotonis]
MERFIGRELSDHRTHERFIVFRTSERDRLRTIIVNMLREYYNGTNTHWACCITKCHCYFWS